MNNRDPIIQLPPPMKNGRYFNFRDICDRNLWDTGYLVKKLQGYGILRPPPNGASTLETYRELGNRNSEFDDTSGT